MSLRALLLAAIVLCSAALAAEPLTPAEAWRILHAARQVDRIEGSFRTESSQTTPRGVRNTTILTRVSADGATCYRREVVDVPSKKHRKTRTKVTIKNEEGVWALRGDTAILAPTLISQELLAEALQARQAESSGKGGQPAAVRLPANSLLARCIELAKHVQLSGERQLREGREFVHIEEHIDKEGQEQLRKMAKEQMALIKKGLPFAIRLIAGPMIAMMNIDEGLAVHTEYLIDGTSGRLISKKSYNAAGKMLGSPVEPKRVAVAALPDDTFALPVGVKIVRAKDLAEYIELISKSSDSKSAASKGEDAKGRDTNKAGDKGEGEDPEES